MQASITQKALAPAVRRSVALQSSSSAAARRLLAPALAARQQLRSFQSGQQHGAPNASILGTAMSAGIPPSYFQKPSLPANTIVRFVPQQTAWIVERMGKFNRILQPGLAILIPFLDRIAYVKSLKEVAIEIPSQSAITADNVTLELDGVLYTRVFDAYKARCVLLFFLAPLFPSPSSHSKPNVLPISFQSPDSISSIHPEHANT